MHTKISEQEGLKALEELRYFFINKNISPTDSLGIMLTLVLEIFHFRKVPLHVKKGLFDQIIEISEGQE